MKRLLSLFILISMLFSVAYADTVMYDAMKNNLNKLTDEELNNLKIDIDNEIAVRREASKTKSGDLGVWKSGYFVDEFKEPTNERYVKLKNEWIIGTFSNSAVSDKQLKVKIIISKDESLGKTFPRIGIELYEYGSNQVKNSASKMKNYSIYLRDGNGETHFFRGYIPAKASRMYIDYRYADMGSGGTNEDFIDILNNNDVVKVQIKENSDYSNDIYMFQFDDTTGLENAIAWVMEGD